MSVPLTMPQHAHAGQRRGRDGFAQKIPGAGPGFSFGGDRL